MNEMMKGAVLGTVLIVKKAFTVGRGADGYYACEITTVSPSGESHTATVRLKPFTPPSLGWGWWKRTGTEIGPNLSDGTFAGPIVGQWAYEGRYVAITQEDHAAEALRAVENAKRSAISFQSREWVTKFWEAKARGVNLPYLPLLSERGCESA